MAPDLTTVPYCGLPPSPDGLWTRWNLDPVLTGALALLACAYAFGARRLGRDGRGIGPGSQAAFYAGWGLAAAALVSPLCALSVSLFSARVGQHVVLVLAAAPLVAAGRPGAALAGLLHPSGTRCARRPLPSAPLLAAGLFAALLWFWHAPGPYAATFASPLAYWAMHASLFVAAVWLWDGLLDHAPSRAAWVIGAGLASSVQMGLLGALITLAPRALYAPHALTTATWGLSPLQDQQLGGVLMWVPGCVVFLAVFMLVLRRSLAQADLPLAMRTP